MKLISTKEFAEQQGVSYQAARQQIRRYHEEIKEHIVTKPGDHTQYLDEYAVRFLNDQRKNSAVNAIFQGRAAEFERLKEENRQLKDKLLEAAERIATIQGEKAQALEDLAELQRQVLAAQDEVRNRYKRLLGEEAQAEIYEPFLFSFTRKDEV